MGHDPGVVVGPLPHLRRALDRATARHHRRVHPAHPKHYDDTGLILDTILEHGLTPFVEVADHDEIASVVRAEECIVAINNKDIRTQEREPGDIDQSRSLLEATIATGTPCPVSASAITDPKVAAELVALGFKGLLIGTGLLRSGNVQGWIDEFEQHRNAMASEPQRTEPRA